MESTSQKSTIEATKLELPKGGGAIKGISEAFEANSFTGTGSFSIPIALPTCRNFSPSLNPSCGLINTVKSRNRGLFRLHRI